ncbi:dCMP deaminase family protein [Leucobacter sp. cx-169]|uniref:deoxycytidylate deaminase n=1 Tax=Leucobacter sp. cx-169 TaxID=2770549 RepID=UPI00165E2FF6|nr:dCMP deaminase family protein [Leucobacter sp. cx-169]MBC9927212.1 dCMP deaminase family protein [Leucobacter sp. cx-169]
MTGPRADVASWEDTFMAMAQVVKLRSKDPSTQVGAVLVSADNRVLSLGYNGAPNGFDDSAFPWGKDSDDPLETKFPYVIHAERNAVLNFRGSLRELAGATAFVTHFPCNECAKELIQVGVRRVIYAEPYRSTVGLTEASIRMFDQVGVEHEQHGQGRVEGAPEQLAPVPRITGTEAAPRRREG